MIINDIAKNIQLISLDKINETLLSNVINNLNSFMQKYGLSLDENIITLPFSFCSMTLGVMMAFVR